MPTTRITPALVRRSAITAPRGSSEGRWIASKSAPGWSCAPGSCCHANHRTGLHAVDDRLPITVVVEQMKRYHPFAVAEATIGLLQRDHIGVDLSQYVQNAIGTASPIRADAFSDIVAGDLNHSATVTQRRGFWCPFRNEGKWCRMRGSNPDFGYKPLHYRCANPAFVVPLASRHAERQPSVCAT